MRVLKDVSDIFFPKTCPICGSVITSDETICFRCKKEIPPVNMENKLNGNWYFDSFFHMANYDGMISRLVKSYKYSQHTSLANLFSGFFLELFALFPPLPNSVITIVPITFNSLKIKGFDHMKIIAKKVSAKSGIPFLNLLEVVKQTKTQVGASDQFREFLVCRKYGVIKENLYKTSGNIILIDDVFTTGATTNECARLLKAAGAKKLYLYTIAKTCVKNKIKEE